MVPPHLFLMGDVEKGALTMEKLLLTCSSIVLTDVL